MSYQGEERRKDLRRSEAEDHDLLTRIDVTVTSIGRNHEDFMRIFREHTEDDKDNFEQIGLRLDGVHKRINDISKYVFIGVGIIAALEFASYWILKK